MRWIAAICLVVGHIGCGGDVYTKLERTGVKLKRDAKGHVVHVDAQNLVEVNDRVIQQLPPSPTIRKVWINGTETTGKGVAHICKCSNISDLFIGRLPLTDRDLIPIGKLKKLSMLYLDGTRITDDGLKHLASCAELKRLNLGFIGPEFTGRGLSHLAKLPKLEYVHLNDNRVTDESVKTLPQLKHLRTLIVSYTELTDDSVKSLVQLKKLTHLDVRGTKITDAAVDRIRKALPKCKVVSGEL